MNEEMMTMMEENENVDAMATTEETGNSGLGLGTKIVLGLIGAGAAAAGAWIATKDWRERRAVARLEKKGYAVTKMVDVPEETVVEVEATEVTK